MTSAHPCSAPFDTSSAFLELEVLLFGHFIGLSRILRFLVSFGRGQTKRFDFELPPAESECPILPNILIAPATALM